MTWVTLANMMTVVANIVLNVHIIVYICDHATRLAALDDDEPRITPRVINIVQKFLN